MATYSFDAVISIVNEDSQDSVYFNGDSELTVVAADGDGFEYEYKKNGGGIKPVNYEAEGYHFLVDGLDLVNYDVDIEFGWGKFSGTGKITVMVLTFMKKDVNGQDEEVVVLVNLDGDDIPSVSSTQEFDDLEGELTDVGSHSSGSFRPDQLIEWSEFNYTSMSDEDEIFGTKGKDKAFGGAGEDTFYSSAGNDTLKGGDDWDTASYAYDKKAIIADLSKGQVKSDFTGTDKLDSIEAIEGSRRSDKMTGNGKDNYFAGNKGEDTLKGGSGSDHVRYNNEDDYGGTDGIKVDLAAGTATDTFGNTDKLDSIENVDGSVFHDKIFGSDDANRLRGRDGKDKIEGGKGKDTIDGGRGADTLEGGGGSDLFLFEDKFGNDKIKDFDATNNKEKIDLSEVSAIKSFDDLENNHLSQKGDDAIIKVSSSHKITLIDVDISDLGSGDFLF
ncbi:hypothetical protein [Amaricoccus macauensis]|uniref:hypothetical protein n=1 Tax=Amaricoccus macauensis TaxID=57001 RepID=UPI003C7AE41D